MASARYDGHAEWYEVLSGSEAHERARSTAVGLVGLGPGRCLDLGAGTGRAIPALVDAGWTVIATDVSQDQLDLARSRSGSSVELVQADAHDMPFADESFDAVLSCFTHTDFDDVSTVFREVARMLVPGGRFVYVGPHPCFGSPFIAREAARDVPDTVALVRPGYRHPGWSHTSFNPEGIRSRVGVNHLPLPDLLNGILAAGLVLSRLFEPNDDDPPGFMGFIADKPGEKSHFRSDLDRDDLGVVGELDR